jgi:UDP-glucuronate 4-epimerase
MNLITGVAGFIGFHLASELLARGDVVYGVDNLNEYYSRSLKLDRLRNLKKYDNFVFDELDLTNRTEVQSKLSNTNPQNVFHLAAQPGVRLPKSDSQKYFDSNLIGFWNILNQAIEFNTPNIFFASSSSVYGNKTDLLSESSKALEPTNLYGATKLSNELLAAKLSIGSQSRIRGLRFFTVYGPWGRPDMAYFKIMDCLKFNKTFTIYGDGEQLRDFTYIKDIVESTVLLNEELRNRQVGFFDVVNVGAGNPTSLNKLIDLLEGFSNKKLKTSYTIADLTESSKTHSDRKYLNQLIQNKQSTPLEVGLKEFYNWHNSYNKLGL